ncbi:hypothetical protein ACCO45_012290 [Purpureocillium lilacinum]|uniref:Uncharacterized protein n=1 Tax=Purpureocillium lilacinum TaxID=33203 RepID=A0ACC4DDH1_PURLI
MEQNHGLARARASCSRCHKRKKRCSFRDDAGQNASFPVHFFSYVRALEQRVRDLEAGGCEPAQMIAPQRIEQDAVAICHDQGYDDSHMDESAIAPPVTICASAATVASAPSLAGPTAATEQPPTFARELQTLSLGAAAERHLGSTSGLSFAKITQKILKRLTPDKADFVFAPNQEDVAGASFFNFNSPSDVFNDSLYQDLSESISIHPVLFGDLFLADHAVMTPNVGDLAWPSDEQHVQHLVSFYFAHSHTLYPILDQEEVLGTLGKIRGKPHELANHSALQNFRLWMILAIGSTAYSSLSLTEESESMGYYEKALQYADQALEQDEMVHVPADSTKLG